MAGSVLVDAGFVVALLSNRDTHHGWAAAQGPQFAPPWSTCEAALSEAFHLVGVRGAPSLSALLQRGSLLVAFELAKDLEPVLKLMQKEAPNLFGDYTLEPLADGTFATRTPHVKV